MASKQFSVPVHKSVVQVIMECDQKASALKNSVSTLLEQFEVNGNAFAMVNGTMMEATKGYFVVENTHDNLDSAILEVRRNYVADNNNVVIRIVENDTFQVGAVFEKYVSCPEGKEIVDLTTQTIVTK